MAGFRIKFSSTLIVLLLLSLTVLPNAMFFSACETREMAITSPQSATLALAEFVGQSCVSLTKRRDAEIPSVHGLSR